MRGKMSSGFHFVVFITQMPVALITSPLDGVAVIPSHDVMSIGMMCFPQDIAIVAGALEPFDGFGATMRPVMRTSLP
jgi:hypothetical protein